MHAIVESLPRPNKKKKRNYPKHKKYTTWLTRHDEVKAKKNIVCSLYCCISSCIIIGVIKLVLVIWIKLGVDEITIAPVMH